MHCYSARMTQSTEQDRAYFSRVGRANAMPGESRPPASLRESFERYDALEPLHQVLGGPLADTQEPTARDLASHLAYLARLRTPQSIRHEPLSTKPDADNGS